MMKPIQVEIIDSTHPHYGERGELTGEMIKLFGKPMALMKLDNCEHGTDDCYVSHGQVRELTPNP